MIILYYAISLYLLSVVVYMLYRNRINVHTLMRKSPFALELYSSSRSVRLVYAQLGKASTNLSWSQFDKSVEVFKQAMECINDFYSKCGLLPTSISVDMNRITNATIMLTYPISLYVQYKDSNPMMNAFTILINIVSEDSVRFKSSWYFDGDGNSTSYMNWRLPTMPLFTEEQVIEKHKGIANTAIENIIPSTWEDKPDLFTLIGSPDIKPIELISYAVENDKFNTVATDGLSTAVRYLRIFWIEIPKVPRYSFY